MPLTGDFRPLPFLRGGHRQTIGGYLLRSRLGWHRPTEEVVIDAPQGVRLLLRASWQVTPRRDRPALLLVHGLEGSDRSSYVLSLGELAYREGWHVVRMNLRGCGGSERLCPFLYNAGVSQDLLAVLDWLASEVERIAVCGFSLGGNLALLTGARDREKIPHGARALVAVSPPLDLAACADALAWPRNRLYQRYFLRKLRASCRRRERLFPELFPAGLERGWRSVREFDDAITAPHGGYAGADDYYARSSSGPLLGLVGLAALVLAAADDPMIPAESVTRWPLGPLVRREVTSTGGHLGFVGRLRAPGFFWAAERVLDFISRED